MASEWYYAREGQSAGPISIDELRRLADSGELQRTDLVWTAPMDEWEEAGGFDEIFPPSAAAPETPEPVRPAAPVPPVAPVSPRPAASPGQKASASPPPGGGRQFQGRAQGGRQGRGTRGGYYGARNQGIPPVVLVGFIVSIAGIAICGPLAIVGAILCMVGLGEAKRRKEGVGLAIAGIVIGLLAFLVGIIALIAIFSMSAGGGF